MSQRSAGLCTRANAFPDMYCFHCIFSPKFSKLVDPQHYKENNRSDHAISVKLSSELLLIKKHLQVKNSAYLTLKIGYFTTDLIDNMFWPQIGLAWNAECINLNHNWETKNWSDYCVFFRIYNEVWISVNSEQQLNLSFFGSLLLVFSQMAVINSPVVYISLISTPLPLSLHTMKAKKMSSRISFTDSV